MAIFQQENPQEQTANASSTQEQTDLTKTTEEQSYSQDEASAQKSETTPVQNEYSQETVPEHHHTTNPGTPTIVDTEVPIVMFIGPPSSGKTMILIRLAKYLRAQGYTIKTDPSFLNTKAYRNDCETFMEKMNTTIALDGSVRFLLVDVYKGSQLIAKLLEAPGEHFYSTTDPKKNCVVEGYLQTIIASPNRKTYIILLDIDDSTTSLRSDGWNRNGYERRIIDIFYKMFKETDKKILLYNKIDESQFGSINRCIDIGRARKEAEKFYPSLFRTMKVKKLGGLIESDDFVFKTFCTGLYSPEQTDNMGNVYRTYTISDNVYPEELWKEIKKRW